MRTGSWCGWGRHEDLRVCMPLKLPQDFSSKICCHCTVYHFFLSYQSLLWTSDRANLPSVSQTRFIALMYLVRGQLTVMGPLLSLWLGKGFLNQENKANWVTVVVRKTGHMHKILKVNTLISLQERLKNDPNRHENHLCEQSSFSNHLVASVLISKLHSTTVWVWNKLSQSFRLCQAVHRIKFLLSQGLHKQKKMNTPTSKSHHRKVAHYIKKAREAVMVKNSCRSFISLKMTFTQVKKPSQKTSQLQGSPLKRVCVVLTSWWG